MTKSPTIGDLLDGQRDGEKPERRLPAVELLMTGPDSAKLFSNGRPLLKGQLKEATAAMNKLGFGPGEEFKMIFPGGAQVVVRLRTSQERKAGISAIVRRLPKETET